MEEWWEHGDRGDVKEAVEALQTNLVLAHSTEVEKLGHPGLTKPSADDCHVVTALEVNAGGRSPVILHGPFPFRARLTLVSVAPCPTSTGKCQLWERWHTPHSPCAPHVPASFAAMLGLCASFNRLADPGADKSRCPCSFSLFTVESLRPRVSVAVHNGLASTSHGPQMTRSLVSLYEALRCHCCVPVLGIPGVSELTG
jgi:hypothetical protein